MTLQPVTKQVTDLLQFYQSVRNQSTRICDPLQPEDYVVQPITDVSPPKWHLGHTTWFFENLVLLEWLEGYELYNEQLNYLFNSYYESLGPRILRSNRGNITRPGLDTVLEYRRVVDDHIDKLLQQFRDKPLPKELHDLIVIGLNHEQQHQELLVYDLKYILGDNPLHPAYLVADAEGSDERSAVSADWIRVEEGIYTIGYQGDGFCYDNEQAPHKVYLQSCEIQDRLITNREYLEFIRDGGYQHFQYWLSEGWEWVKQQDVKAPLYWFERDGDWYEYTLRGAQKLHPDLPVTHVNYFEADAFARWRDCRLPTETEWEVACNQCYEEVPRDGNFLDKGRFMPAARRSPEDYQMLGNAWEWTSSAYLPYPGFPRREGALGEYNAKFMVNQMVLRGGSYATPITHIRPTYRNFFHPDKRWQITGIRLAR